MWELLAENRTAVLLGHARGRWSISYHWSKQGAHIHHYRTHAHSHYQWQLWTAVSPLLGLTLSYWVLSCRGEFFKCQLHTTHVGAVDWEPHGSSPTICAGNGDHGFGVRVPLALICLLKIVNLTVLLHKEFEIPTLSSKFFEILEFVFLSEVAPSSFCVKFSGLKSPNIQRTDLYFVSF